MSDISSFFEKISTYYQRDPETSQRLKNHLALNQPAVFQDRQKLFGNLLELLLRHHKIPHTPGSPHKELRPLYQLIDAIDPHYYGTDQILKRLHQCFSLGEAHKALLLSSISHFLKILRTTQLQPEKMGNSESLAEWYQVFPEMRQWDVLAFLEKQGVWTTSSYSGFQAWSRYNQGILPSRNTPHQTWAQVCRNIDSKLSSALELNTYASAFAGELTHWGIKGFCGDAPHCEECPLKADCRWHVKPSMASLQEDLWTSIQKAQLQQHSTSELLAWLFALASPEKEEFQALFPQETPLKRLEKFSLYELTQKMPQLSPIAERLKVLLELCKRYNEVKLTPGSPFRCSQDIFTHFQYRLPALKQEQFILVLLDNQHQYLMDEVVSMGILNKSLVHPREVFAKAIEHRAAAIICVHNHPSGDPKASPEDLNITKRLKEASQIIGIPLLDHLIIGNDQYTSLADEGLL
ncbi:DNA repair protein RadC [Deltaproteobacteria bacterium TL4]